MSSTTNTRTSKNIFAGSSGNSARKTSSSRRRRNASVTRTSRSVRRPEKSVNNQKSSKRKNKKRPKKTNPRRTPTSISLTYVTNSSSIVKSLSPHNMQSKKPKQSRSTSMMPSRLMSGRRKKSLL
jgi:hypothetical protein